MVEYYIEPIQKLSLLEHLKRFFNAPEGGEGEGRMISSDLTTIPQEAVNLLEIHRAAFKDEADNMGCDAGNPDGGSALSCKHCQLIRDIEEIDQILNKASVWTSLEGNRR